MTQGVSRLKELLFDTENETLNSLDQRVGEASERLKALETLTDEEKRERLEVLRKLDGLFDRAGTEERFSTSVSLILDDALRKAEVKRHNQLSRALAPLVVSTIKTELKNSQDEMVQLLYPLTGRMVKSYVASAIQDLANQINQRLEQNPISIRIRSWMTGKPVAELAIVESQRLQIEEVFLIQRGAGTLLARWPDGGALSNSDIHLSGVLSAINDFSTQAFSDDGGNLRTFKFDDFHVYLRASPMYLLAAKCRGIPATGIETIFDDAFLDILDRLQMLQSGDGASSEEVIKGRHLSLLDPMAELVGSKTTEIYDANARAGTGFNPLRLVFFLLLVPLLTWGIWKAYTSAEEARTLQAARGVVSETVALQGYDTKIDVGYRGKSLSITGLTPNKIVRSKLIAQLGEKLPDTQIGVRLAVLPTPKVVDLSPQIDRLRRELATLEIDVLRRQTMRSLDGSVQRLRLLLPELRILEQLVKGASAKERVGKVIGIVSRAGGEIDRYRVALTSLPRRGQRENRALLAPINGLSKRLRGAGEQISTLIRLGPELRVASEHVLEPPSDVAVASEVLAAQTERLSSMTLAVAKAIAQARLIKPPPPPPLVKQPTPREKLVAFSARHAIFFSNDTGFLRPDKSKALLDELAALMRGNTILLRVVGYTDETGGVQRNDPLATSRAEKVLAELVKRGVARNRLVPIGRSEGVVLSTVTGAGSPNRRVQFEIGFEGEAR